MRTERLELVPASLRLLHCAFKDRGELARLMAVVVAEDWPSEELQGALPAYIGDLERQGSMSGWGLWLIVEPREQALVGDVGFKGGPDRRGAVEIGYGIAPGYRRRGYALEAAAALVQWAFGRPEVRRVIAECLPDNTGSIKVLEGLGMRQTHREGRMLKWELPRPL